MSNFRIFETDELELRPEVEDELKESMKSTKRIPAEEVAKELGIEW